MIIFTLILGLGLRLISLNQSFWIDEATSASTIKMSLAQFFGKFMPGDFHPPLYYLTARVWSMFFGTSEIALRSLSVLFGILTIYVVYLIGKEINKQSLSLRDKNVGIIASILLATSGLHIYYSQEARMYSMSTFLVTLAIYFFIHLRQGYGGQVKIWIGYAITLGLIGATDYLPLLILPIFWIYGVLSKQKFTWFKKLFMSHIILFLFAILWMPTFLKQLSSGLNVVNHSPAWVSVLGKFSIKDILLIPVKFGIGRVGFDNKFIYGFVVLIVFSIFGYLLFKGLRLIFVQRTTSLWLGLWLIVPLILALIISLKFPVLNYFRFLFVLPALYLILASGKKKLVILVVVINLITSFMYLTNIRFQREDWRGFSKFIGNNPVIFPADSQKEAFLYYNSNANILNVNDLNNMKNVWLMRYAQPISDPSDSTRMKIENLGYIKTNEYDFNGVTVFKYAKSN
ncbi:hypothetical protein BH10PAT1_BH10PAT1_3080 [soil metagenome]